jgi:uncharacterized protein (TIGR02270 family)
VNVFIEIVSGPNKGQHFTLSDNQLLHVGRTKKSEQVISEDDSISSRHFSIECWQETCQLKDLGSRNGTFLNGRKVADAYLKTGDEIRAGHTTFVVSILDISSATRASTRSPQVQHATEIQDGHRTAILTVAQTSFDVPSDSSNTVKNSNNSFIDRSPRHFYVELYEEHLEEASFLYAQRLTLFDDPEIAWPKIGEWEERLEAHIDALVIGEDLALEVCEKQAAEGDFGVLFAAISVFCRQQRFHLVKKILEALDPSDHDKLQAVADALKFECPPGWFADIPELLPPNDPRLRFVLSTLYGYRRLKTGMRFVPDEATLSPLIIRSLSWTMGRVGDNHDIAQLQSWLSHEDESVSSSAAVALLRLSEHRVFQETDLQEHVSRIPWSIRAIAASPKELSLLLAHVSRNRPTADDLVALGIIGEIGAIPLLLSHLTNEALAPAAALGLNVITGAELYEKAFIPEIMEDDELFDEEKEQARKGQPVLRPDGKPYGENIVRLSQKVDEWKAWWAANTSRFAPGLRYRRGVPLTPVALVDSIAFDKTPRRIRELSYEELVVRYRADIPFETDMPVRHQQDAIFKMKSWAKVNEERFKPGEWYLAGQPIVLQVGNTR